MPKKKYNLRKAKGIMQYCKDEIDRQNAAMDYEEDENGSMVDFGEAAGKYLAMAELLRKLKKSNPLVKLD